MVSSSNNSSRNNSSRNNNLEVNQDYLLALAQATSEAGGDNRSTAALEQRARNIMALKKVAAFNTKEKEDLVARNTKRSYEIYAGSGKNSFLVFCNKHFSEEDYPCRVTGAKLLMYLHHRRSEGQSIKVIENGKPIRKTVPFSFSTVEQMCSAITSLYRKQVSEEKVLTGGYCDWPHPRNQEVKDYLKSFKETVRKTNIGTSTKSNKEADIVEVYGQDGLEAMIKWGVQKTNGTKSYVGPICALVVSQSLLYRGDSLRDVDITDLRFSSSYRGVYNDATSLGTDILDDCESEVERAPRPLNGQLPSYKKKRPAELLVFLSRNSKTNKENNRTITGCLRHMDVIFCPQFWLAAYLMERFHVNKEEDISFDERSSFFKMKLLSNFNGTRSRDTAVDYQYYYENHKLMMKGAGIHTDHVRDAPRASGAQICHVAGVPVSDVERFGEWRTEQYSSSLVGNYIYNIPFAPMAALAGVEDVQHSQYSMIRNFVKPDNDLKRKIFPFINDYLDEALRANIEDWDEEERQARGQQTSEAASSRSTRKMAHLTAKTLDHLRTVVLQDFKFIEEAFGTDIIRKIPVFQLEIFKSQEYRQFRTKQDSVYNAYYARINNPAEAWKDQPDMISAFTYMATNINDLRNDLRNDLAKSDAKSDARWAKIEARMDEMEARLEAKLDHMLLNSSGSGGNISSSTSVDLTNNSSDNSSTQQQQSTAPQEKTTLPTFHFKKAPASFATIWNEYRHTYHGQPSVEQLEKTFGSKWRKDGGISKTFSRRNVIYKAVKHGVSKGMKVEECLKLLEATRAVHDVSVTKFMDKRHLVPEELGGTGNPL